MKTESVLRSGLRRSLAGICAGAALALLSACGSAPVVPKDPPLPPLASTAQADQQLAAVARDRAAIEARFAERERVCYTKFFVNRCLDEARELHRSSLAAQRLLEVQAEHFKRKAVVDERDRQMAIAEKKYQEDEARLAAQPPKPAPVVAPEAAPRAPTAPARTAERNARLQAVQQQDARDTEKRAQNVRDYEARKANAEESQRRIAKRKADKAARDAKEAADKAKAAQGAAPAQAKPPGG
jgi:colicin import membrane protein